VESYTLYELNSIVRGVIEDAMDEEYWVQGELSEGAVRHGGHFYGELVQKDAKGKSIIAKARIVCWANVYRGISLRFESETGETLRAGLKVLLLVKVNFHEQYGYSLSIEDVNPAFTVGDMAQRRREILAQLEEDGILHDNQQLELPVLAQRIAVISSASAAGYGDFCNQLLQNDYAYRFHIKLFPAVMQGAKVEESIISALEDIAEESEQWDAVVIIRGGGATSDLSDFDSYHLASCIAQYPLPVITGIGHERDETVLDYVAHTHMKTPTAVASFLIDHLSETAERLGVLQQKVTLFASKALALETKRLGSLMVQIPLAFANVRQREENRMEKVEQRIRNAWVTGFQKEKHRQELLEQRFKGLDPLLLLERGYSITMANGKVVHSVTDVCQGEEITTKLKNGEIRSTVL